MAIQMLNSLEIKNFRALKDFTINQLGQVNLIVGKNNSGKSSVLEALRIYAGKANYKLLTEIAKSHDEKYPIEKQYQEGELNKIDNISPFQDFFSGRTFPKNIEDIIIIGEINSLDKSLSIQHTFIREIELTVTNEIGKKERRIHKSPVIFPSTNDFEKITSEGFIVGHYGHSKTVLIDFNDLKTNPRNTNSFYIGNTLPCSLIPTRYIAIDELADIWDVIALTEGESAIKQALKIILPEFENLIFVNNQRVYSGENQRSAKVKITGLPHPVPLKSLGDGMLRVLQLILKIFPAQGGILLIDEFENGLHYSVQEEVWHLLFTLAKQLDVQIFATTHSWDCVSSFAKVAIEQKEVEGVALRIGQSIRKSDKGRIISTVFNEEELQNIIKIDMDIR